LAQALERSVRRIFNNVMEYSDDALIVGVHSQHHSQGVQDVGRACLVALVCVSLDSYADGAFQCSHWVSKRL